MKHYFAAAGNRDFEMLIEEKVPSILVSYAYCLRGVPELLKKAGVKKDIMLDSGGFTVQKKPGVVTLEGYMEFLDGNKKYIDEYVTLDHPQQRKITLMNYSTMMEKGYKPLYVDHAWFKWIPQLDKMYKEKKLCWGGMDNLWKKKQVDRLNFRYEKAKAHPKTKLHLLGVSTRLRKYLPWFDHVDSFDAATWKIAPKVYGKLAIFREPCEKKPFPRLQFVAPPWTGVRPPKEVYELFEKYKLKMSDAEDRARGAIRELKKYYAGLEKFYDDNKSKGFDWLQEVALLKETFEDVETEYPLQVYVRRSDSGFEKGAEKSASENKVEVGRFFYQPKPTRAAFANQLQSPALIVKMFQENADKWLPAFVQKKYDGARFQIHRNGEKISIFSEDQNDATGQFPEVEKALLALKPTRFVLDVELEKWDGKQHLPREAMAGAIHQKEAEATGIIANVFDILYLDKDVHEEPYSKRLELLSSIGIAQNTIGVPEAPLNLVPSFLCKTPKELEKHLSILRKAPGSEGIVVKRAASTYPLELVTPDTWIKFHNATTIRGVVYDRKPIKNSNGWNYYFGVLPGKKSSLEEVEVGTVALAKVGLTFNTNLDIKDGDGILVEAETVNLTDWEEGKYTISAWVPRVIGPWDGEPDTIDSASNRARENLVLQEKKIGADGEVTFIPVSVSKADDVYLETPPENRKYPYIVHFHFRGAGVHADFRIGFRPDDLLLGWTLNIGKPDAIKEPVLTLKDARTLTHERMGEISKINFFSGEWDEREKRGMESTTRTLILSERKAPEPWEWINVEGATKAPQEGEAPPVGGTRNFPGVFEIVDRGVVEFGAQKPWLHEYFVSGTGMNYRVFLRQLKLGQDTSQSVYDVNKEILPPSSGEADPSGFGQWLFIYPDDQTPYVLSKDAMKSEWMPPVGISALPADVRSQIPFRYHYWKIKDQAHARMNRDYLIDEIQSGKIELDFKAPYKKMVAKLSSLDAKFVLQEQTWKGPQVVRSGPSRRRYFLRIDEGKRNLQVIEFPSFPDARGETLAQLSSDPHKESMGFEGDIKPGHYLNQTKDTPSTIRILDKGDASILASSDAFIKLKLSGKDWKGVYTLTKNPNGDEWSFVQSETAPTVEKSEQAERKEEEMADFNASVSIGMPITKVDEDKRLVTGIVLEPNIVDAQGDTIAPEAIERSAHNFLAKYNRETEMGLMHQAFGEIGVELVESYLSPDDLKMGGQKVSKGTWIMTVRVNDAALWKKIKNHEITGFSIGGMAAVV